MRLCLIGSAIISVFFLAACQPTQIEYVEKPVSVPEDLRKPVSVPKRQAETLKDVALVLTDHVEALGRANGQIVAIDCILDAAENGVEPKCLEASE